MDKEFVQKIKAMNITELREYKQVAESVSRFIHLVGISVAVIIVFFTNFLTIFIGFCTLAILGKTSIGVDNTIDLIKEEIITKTLSADK